MIYNVKIKDVQLYISLCNYCQNIKNNRRNKKNISSYLVKSPIVSKSFNQRAQIDLIDIKALGVNECLYILNYQDNLTKFCILKPLPDKHLSIKQSLMEIFNLLGTPKLLHCDNGGEFRGKHLLEYFKTFWPDMKIIRGKPYNPRSQGSVERANGQIKDLILACITNGVMNYNLTDILLKVQYVKNTTYNRTIKCSPYKALFGQDVMIEQKIENLFPSLNDIDDKNNENKIDIENRIQNVEKFRTDTFTNIKNEAHRSLSFTSSMTATQCH